MPKLPGIKHLDAVRAFEKAGFRIARQGKHIIMTNGKRKISIPRNNPINALTMAAIVRDAGLTLDEFRHFL
jgi:predicted RNA binding protein YcfA (HicA-like mRNA interferase family)